jgi:hypothetical protein
MKNIVALQLLLVLCPAAFAQQVKTVTISNPVNQKRTDELVTISRSLLDNKTGIKNNYPYYIIKSKKGVPVVVQFDDLDQDGRWDEAVFLYSFAPKEKAVFTIAGSKAPATIKAVVRAHVRQRHKMEDNSFGDQLSRDTMPYNNLPTDFSKQKLPPYLTEGPAWENDKVGFRKYFDLRNANDIWGKVTNRMVLDEVGVDPSKIYHNYDSTWGMDILKVGKSLGAGALALQVQVNGKDSLVRFGRDVRQTTYEQIADGPVRAIFRISYKGWKIGSLSPIDITEEISIWGGQYFFQNKVTTSQLPAGTQLVTGVIDFYNTGSHPWNGNGASGLYTYGVQSENKDKLGLAVLASSAQVYKIGTIASGDINNVFGVWMKPALDGSVKYRFYSAWEKTDPLFGSEEAFGDFLAGQAALFQKPVVVK